LSRAFAARVKAMARAAPPEPIIVTVFPASFTPASLSACSAPGPSLPNPVSRPPSLTTVLTDPMRRSTSATSSRCRRIDTLCGMVTLRPRKFSRARMPATAAPTSSTRNATYT